MQHIELFESSLEQTKGDDIARVMWRKSMCSFFILRREEGGSIGLEPCRLLAD